MTHSATPKKKAPAVILLMTMTMLGVFGLDVLLPSFPALARHFRTTPEDIALSISLFAVGISLSQLFIGPLSDAMGRKKLLLAGLAISIIGAMGCVLSSEYSWFLTFRVVQALGCGCFILAQALVQDLFEGVERDRLRILMVMSTGIFISVSPLAGAVLQELLDWPGSFMVFSALAAGVFLCACFSLEKTHGGATGGPPEFIRSYRRVYSDFEFVSYWLISAFAFACHFSFIVISPLIFMERLQLSPHAFSLTLLIYGVAYLVGGAIATLLSRRIGNDHQIIIGLSLILLSGLSMLYISGRFALSPSTVLIPMIICTAGTTIARPAATSRAMALFPESAGTASAAGSMLVFICGGLISALVSLSPGSVHDTLGYSFIALSTLALVLSYRINSRCKSALLSPDSQ
ncbi:multidrug effflux MFS transporter [Pseudomonas sp. Irchel 3A7]|jgi:Bcr/CflA subfamily drug resistance transporter|uniref:multidrug effflux MFS transporter n=1 Tax=Pseudomonas sp. Irchel 3A7 TaxID=2008913 RepID=UPI000BA2C05C|nr:multidrug effflux MFS transporter [Pseudomonas sp. Irchel 3A7]